MNLTASLSRLAAAACLLASSGWALDSDLRVAARLATGTTGPEPGVALEWRDPARPPTGGVFYAFRP